jgi:hypothetical protein
LKHFCILYSEESFVAPLLSPGIHEGQTLAVVTGQNDSMARSARRRTCRTLTNIKFISREYTCWIFLVKILKSLPFIVR